jgi:SHS2 domain-containing protein
MEELFLAGLEGMAALLAPPAVGEHSSPLAVDVAIESLDATSLLIDFLSEALTMSEIRRAVFRTALFTRLDATSLAARLEGAQVECFERDIKAVTHHAAAITRGADGNFETMVIFDI